LTVTIQDQLEKAEAQLLPGDFDKAIELIDKVLVTKNLTEQEKHAALNQKAEILNYFGQHREALVITEKILKEGNKKTADPSIMLVAKVNKNQAEFLLGIMNSNAILKQIDELLQEINALSKKTKQEYLKQKGILLGTKGEILGITGEIQKGLENGEKAIVITKQLGSKHYQLHISTQQAMIHIVSNELHKAEEILERNFKKARELGNKREEAFVYLRYGLLEISKSEYKKSLEYYLKCEQVMNEAKSKYYYPILCLNLSKLYFQMSQLENALAYSQKALEFGFRTQYMHNIIASVYLWRNELVKAQESYQSALAVAQTDQDRRMLPEILYNLVLVTIEKNDFATAQKYFKQLKQLQKEHTTALTTSFYKFAAIILYKASSNISDWGKAVELLKNILQGEVYDVYKIDALFSLLEIRIKELQIQPTKEALTVVQKQLSELQKEAEDKKIHMVFVNSYRLKSKLALVELNVKKAIELLVTARTLAEEKNLELLVQQILKDQQKINEQLSMWNTFQEENVPLRDLLREAHLETTAQEIAKDSVLEVRNKETETVIEYRKLFSIKF